MIQGRNIYRKLNWTLIVCYLILIIFGWMNIFASIYSEDIPNMFSLSLRSGNQIIWIGIALSIAILLIFFINPRIYTGLSWWFYAFVISLLVAVMIFGKEVNGSKSWLMIGSFGIQPSEFSKITTSLCISMIMSKYGFKVTNGRDMLKVLITIFIPVGLIALEPDMGTILVYCGFVFVLYREGLSGWFILFAALIILLFILTLKFSPFIAILVLIAILITIDGILYRRIILNILFGAIFITLASFIPRVLEMESMSKINKLDSEYVLLILTIPLLLVILIRSYKHRIKHRKYIILSFICSVILIFSVDFIYDNLLKEHHRNRIENLLGITEDLKGSGYNVNQSKIAIGSGGLFGKGYLQGTQTKFNFVPEQSTDFIFCTIGEEWGFAGSIGVLLVFFIMITNIISTAEKQKDKLVRIYGYCVASCLFMHVVINIGMTIGLMPVVGIPLPYISYGGSSFISFTILLFIYIRLDLDRWR